MRKGGVENVKYPAIKLSWSSSRTDGASYSIVVINNRFRLELSKSKLE